MWRQAWNAAIRRVPAEKGRASAAFEGQGRRGRFTTPTAAAPRGGPSAADGGARSGMSLFQLALIYGGVGALVGLLAGLLGIGGGLLIVPVLLFVFGALGFPGEHVLHLALGTSFANIFFTSLSSLRQHHARSAVDWQAWKRITPGIVVGTLAGATLAARTATGPLKLFFTVFVLYVATQMLLDIRPKPHRQLPGRAGMTAAGLVIGFVSALVSIAGAALSVPFLTWCNIGSHRAIGTAAAIGFPIAAAGLAGYVVNGLFAEGLPAYTLGFVYLPAWLGLVLASMVTVPVGVSLAHRLPARRLKQVFAVFLYAIAAHMVAGLL